MFMNMARNDRPLFALLSAEKRQKSVASKASQAYDEGSIPFTRSSFNALNSIHFSRLPQLITLTGAR